MVLPVEFGRDAHFFGKQLYKILAVGVAHRVGNFVELTGRVGQQQLGPVYPQLGKFLVDGMPTVS